jgi:CRP/FNR family cyclic AMP-dependent transcriptional regulator
MAKTNIDFASTDFLKKTGPGRSIRVYRDKEVIFLQGSSAKTVFFLQSGIVKLTAVSKRRPKKAVIAVLQEGDLFGEGCLGRQPERISTATSIGQSTITHLDKVIFSHKIDRDPAFAALFTKHLLSQIARFEADLVDHFLNLSERRLARILLMYPGLGQKSKKGTSPRRFSQTTLAEMVGTTRSRVSSFMNAFREKGYIRYNGNLEIDSERLTAFLED